MKKAYQFIARSWDQFVCAALGHLWEYGHVGKTKYRKCHDCGKIQYLGTKSQQNGTEKRS